MSRVGDIYAKNANSKKPIFSFEFFPPKTEAGLENLYERLDRMGFLGPSWIDVTWGAGGSTSKLTLDICANAQNYFGLETMMHMTCTNMPRVEIKKALQEAKDRGIRNILALRGDPPRGEEWKQVEGGFARAIDLIRFIRAEYGNYFGICVAGYPEGHIEATSYESDLKYLKEKIDAGADMVITQLFYDTSIFLKFVRDCRALGIQVPIVPGILPIHTYAGFERMTSLCKTVVPKEIRDALEPIKNDDEAVKNYGVELGIKMCKILIENGIHALHFYTLNLEKSVTQILEGLELVDSHKPLPWRHAPRAKEDVRPVFWSNRPKSYIQRTGTWDDFPNGRWGDSRSPAFGELTDYHIGSLHKPTRPEGRKIYSDSLPSSEQEVFQIFADYCGGAVAALPWTDSPLALETDLIKENLIRINRAGFLTINSQPRVNAAPSTDPRNGWGPKGGYVYQKAYVEFFTSPKNMQSLIEVSKRYPDITYIAVSKKGESFTNTSMHVAAITWGVFPGREIQQPTVVDPDSFFVWKDEAFALWGKWANEYKQDTASHRVLQQMIDSYYLVSLVDNNFINGDIFAIFDSIQKYNQA